MHLSMTPSPWSLLLFECVYVCGGGGGALNCMGGGPVLSQPGPFPSSQALRMTLAESAITHPSEQETHTSAFSSRPLMCLEVIVWRAQDGSGGGEGTGASPGFTVICFLLIDPAVRMRCVLSRTLSQSPVPAAWHVVGIQRGTLEGRCEGAKVSVSPQSQEGSRASHRSLGRLTREERGRQL